jgi:hypothetical protein
MALSGFDWNPGKGTQAKFQTELWNDVSGCKLVALITHLYPIGVRPVDDVEV